MGLDLYITVYDDENKEIIYKHWRKNYWLLNWFEYYLSKEANEKLQNDIPVTISINTLKILLAECYLVKENPYLLEDFLTPDLMIEDFDSCFYGDILYTIKQIENIFDFCLVERNLSQYELVFKVLVSY